MFTGIIETIGEVTEIEHKGENVSFWISSDPAASLQVDQSVSHNGVCLTVEALRQNEYRVTAIGETLSKTNLGSLARGSHVNLERCMLMGGRLDGHLVQGHVDCTGQCLSVIAKDGSWEYVFSVPPQFSSLIIEKGSITLNGISLTIFDITDITFKVAIIPFTYDHTNIGEIKVSGMVNIEFDVIGKYIQRVAALQSNQ